MCYMESIGVRELRQHASRYVERAAAGESLQVTNHGKPVALLVPLAGRARPREDLIAEGLVIPGRGEVLDVEPIAPPEGAPSSAELLAEMREER